MTLLWMMGVNTPGLLSAVKPADVTGMSHEQALAFVINPIWGTFVDYDDLRAWFPGADRNLLLDGYGALTTPVVNFVDINLTSGNDIFLTGHGDDRIFGNAGGDTIVAHGGSDTLSGGSGDDQLTGGEGFDFADYSGGGEQTQSQPSQGIRAAFTVNDDHELVGTVTDSWGDADQLNGIEFLIGTNSDDRVRIVGDASDIFWSTNTQLQADGGGNTALGDVLDFSGLEGSSGLDVKWDTDGVMEVTQSGSFGAITVENFENVIGSAGNDTITGSDQANYLAGGLGADFLFGGGGDDFIFFDAADGANVNGGEGRDTAWALTLADGAGVTVDMGAQSLEVVIGSMSADSIVFRGAEEQMAAGGEGDDSFTLDFTGEDGLRTVWGGAGADQIIASSPGLLRVMVATVTGLTAETFPRLAPCFPNFGQCFGQDQGSPHPSHVPGLNRPPIRRLRQGTASRQAA